MNFLDLFVILLFIAVISMLAFTIYTILSKIITFFTKNNKIHDEDNTDDRL